jgi:tetracycline repressor-like protein
MVFGPVRSTYAARLAAARAEGTLVSDAHDDELLDMAFGPIWFRLLTRPEALTEEFGDVIAHTLLEDRPVPGPARAKSAPAGADDPPTRNRDAPR